IIGVVLNGLKAEISPDYEYHDKYYYYYGSERKKKPTLGKKIASLPEWFKRHAGTLPGTTKSPGGKPATGQPRSGIAGLKSLFKSRMLNIILLLLAIGLLGTGFYYMLEKKVLNKAGLTDLPYTVQVDATQYLRAAREKVAALKSKGYDAHREMVDLKQEGIWYRIYLGRFASEDEAGRYILKEKIKAVYPRCTIRRLENKHQPSEKPSAPQ
ncbi:MAG: SPOR domain-containing protein, partial [Deltaproteobacteria bacterium]|nr:SPOR domain-containing protein [Deltaproteobacteria bacterium]